MMKLTAIKNCYNWRVIAYILKEAGLNWNLHFSGPEN
jgi:hypothetical protein